MGSKFSDATVYRIGIAGLILSGIVFLIVMGALATGNFDQHVRSLVPTAVLGAAVYLGTQAVLKKRINDAD
jgi:heme/copper-type cytochrome/quinol oxidase subunit 3